MTAESEAENLTEEEDDLNLRVKLAAEEETGGGGSAINVLCREMPARGRRPPQWLFEYVSRLYGIFHYMTQSVMSLTFVCMCETTISIVISMCDTHLFCQ